MGGALAYMGNMLGRIILSERIGEGAHKLRRNRSRIPPSRRPKKRPVKSKKKLHWNLMNIECRSKVFCLFYKTMVLDLMEFHMSVASGRGATSLIGKETLKF